MNEAFRGRVIPAGKWCGKNFVLKMAICFQYHFPLSLHPSSPLTPYYSSYLYSFVLNSL